MKRIHFTIALIGMLILFSTHDLYAAGPGYPEASIPYEGIRQIGIKPEPRPTIPVIGIRLIELRKYPRVRPVIDPIEIEPIDPIRPTITPITDLDLQHISIRKPKPIRRRVVITSIDDDDIETITAGYTAEMVMAMVDYMFRGGPKPKFNADVNGDGQVDISDLVTMVDGLSDYQLIRLRFLVNGQDPDGESKYSAANVIAFVNYMFEGGDRPTDFNMDANGDGSVDISDLVTMIDGLNARELYRLYVYYNSQDSGSEIGKQIGELIQIDHPLELITAIDDGDPDGPVVESVTGLEKATIESHKVEKDLPNGMELVGREGAPGKEVVPGDVVRGNYPTLSSPIYQPVIGGKNGYTGLK